MTTPLEVYEVVDSEPGYMRLRGRLGSGDVEVARMKGPGTPSETQTYPVGTACVRRRLLTRTFVPILSGSDAKEIPDPGIEVRHGGDADYVYERRTDLLLPEGDPERVM